MENNKEKEVQKNIENTTKKAPYPGLAVALIFIILIVGGIIVGSLIYSGVKYLNTLNFTNIPTSSSPNDNTSSAVQNSDIGAFSQNSVSNNTSQNNTTSSSSQSIFLDSIPVHDLIAKPIIYIYPTEETDVTVKLGKPENLTHTYPKYSDSWNVLASPDGNLYDYETGRNYYSLYWEGINTVAANLSEGFVIKGSDTIRFLEEKLAILGLNEREINEFIIYWLPQLENNTYNFIRFQTIEEINQNMPLEITPTPDTLIRVIMEFKALEESISVQEQILTPIQRFGYTVVEWGGTNVGI